MHLERKIPRTMATQHPDNARAPSWVRGEVLEGEDEVQEAFFCYEELGCQEVMWDSEGKDVDTRVIRKLLSSGESYFKNHIIGKDVYLTYRLPNPRLDRAEKKIIIETLENIAVGHDVASVWYGFEVSPIFEVILPMTTMGEELLRLSEYYSKVVAGTDKIQLSDLSVADWLGPIEPKSIYVIPLVEDAQALLSVDNIVKPYIKGVRPNYMRVFIARSDPALHYGLLSAVLMSKIALYKLKSLEIKTRTPIYPIIGVGSMPFRGHLSPSNIQGFLNEYKGAYTVTIQSALKYDYQPEETKALIQVLNEKLPNGEIPSVIEDEKTFLNLISKTTSYYQDVIEPLAPLINSVASLVPPRRARKFHVGLFGYSRMIRTAQLPRAIPFACAFYSLGVPPEFVGLRILNELTEKEQQVLQEYYLNMETDLKNVAGIASHQCLDLLKQEADKVAVRANISKERLLESINYLQKDLDIAQTNLGIKIGPTNLKQRKYENLICNFIISFITNEEDARKNMVEAALLRKCLG